MLPSYLPYPQQSAQLTRLSEADCRKPPGGSCPSQVCGSVPDSIAEAEKSTSSSLRLIGPDSSEANHLKVRKDQLENEAATSHCGHDVLSDLTGLLHTGLSGHSPFSAFSVTK